MTTADFYPALLRCKHCDRTPRQHRWDDDAQAYVCEDDPAKWVDPHHDYRTVARP